MSDCHQSWNGFDDQNAVAMGVLDDQDRPSQDTSESIDASSWINVFMQQAESMPMGDGTEHSEGHIVQNMPFQTQRSTSSSSDLPKITPPYSATQCPPPWPPTTAQQHTLPSPLQSNPVYYHGADDQYQHYARAPGSHGLGIELPAEFSTYGMRADADVNQFLFNGPTKVEPSEHANEGAGLPNVAYYMRSTPATEMECYLGTDGDDEGGEIVEQSYAKVLFECLLKAEDHTRSLKEIYDWVERKTSKAKDPTSKGWMNSVRHNLSMNAAFEKVPSSSTHGAKKGGAGLWRLTDDALTRGVISTTRYRKETKRKHEHRIGGPAPKRQNAGSKGGQATRDSSRRNRQIYQRSKFNQATSAPAQRNPHQYYHDNRLATPLALASTASSPAMDSISMLDTPLAHQFQHDRFSSVPPVPMQFQYFTSMPPSTPMHMMTGSPVFPAIRDWEFADIDPTNGERIADPERWYPGSTPGLTSDSSPFPNSVGSLQSPLHISRESSVAT